MPEYINRDDMTYLYNNGEYNVFSVNEDAETVNVIRCKDCDNYCTWDCPISAGNHIPAENMWCAWAERKEDDRKTD